MADITVRGVRLNYQKLGVADAQRATPPVVFLHGLVMDNLASWYFTVANAVAAHAEALVYDLRGHGKSERPQAGYTLADMVLDLAGLLDATFGDVPVTLVGNSFGGLLAVAFARAYPMRVAGLVLVDAHLGDTGFGEQMARTLELTGEERDARIAASFKDWVGRHSARKRNRLAESAEELVVRTSLVSDMRATRPMDARELAEVQAPILALYGEASDLRVRSERLLAGLPRCTLRVLPGCTHSILWEATDTVRDAVVAFVCASARLRGTAPSVHDHNHRRPSP
jgi:pimeloyl-ACP methyl ester carboxylesterase